MKHKVAYSTKVVPYRFDRPPRQFLRELEPLIEKHNGDVLIEFDLTLCPGCFEDFFGIKSEIEVKPLPINSAKQITKK